MRRPWFAYLVSVAVFIAVLYPLSFAGKKDSFPLSDFPMFARGKKKPMLTQNFVVATWPDGKRRPVPPEIVANAEVLLAQATIRRAVRGGGKARRAFCDDIAKRVVGSSDFDEATEIRLMRGTYNAVDYLTGVDKTGREKIWVRCRIARTP